MSENKAVKSLDYFAYYLVNRRTKILLFSNEEQ